MTDPVPYTAEELEAAIGNLSCFDALSLSYAVEMRGSDCLRLAATLRGFQRVLAENAALRADAQRWRFVRSRGMVAVNEDDEPCFCAWLRESEIPDTLHPSVMEGGGTKDPEQLDDVVDAARSGGEGEG